jgi:hypothetical protein
MVQSRIDTARVHVNSYMQVIEAKPEVPTCTHQTLECLPLLNAAHVEPRPELPGAHCAQVLAIDCPRHMVRLPAGVQAQQEQQTK